VKMDFLPFGGGRGLPRRWIERRMKRLDVEPLDDARRPIRTGLIAVGIFFVVFVLFGTLMPISGAAIAEGEVSTSGSRLMIQPEGTGLVSQVLVREGQFVRAGQPLVRLNGLRSGASLRQAQARRDSLRALEARLIAERDNRDQLLFPPDLASRSADRTAGEAMRAQRAIFERHRPILDADRQITDVRSDAARARHEASVRQLALIEDELTGVRQLYRRGFARKATLNALERTAAQLRADIATGQAAITEAEMNRRRTLNSQQMEIVNQLTEVQNQLAQINPQLDVSRYEADRDILRAPVDGRVSGLAQVGPGAVVSGGRTLMEIVPEGRSLVIDVRVMPDDVDDVRLGQEATVRFSTVNPHGRTNFEGRVVTLSPNRVGTGEGGQGYFRAQIALADPAALERAGVSLRPGLPASVQIRTQSRTLFGYLFGPLGDAFNRSFREE